MGQILYKHVVFELFGTIHPGGYTFELSPVAESADGAAPARDHARGLASQATDDGKCRQFVVLEVIASPYLPSQEST